MSSASRHNLRIIVNADDLGISTATNDSILALIEEGKVTSATVIMNAPAAEDAIRRIPQYPKASFGIHLNVTKFAPFAVHPGLRTLLDETGEFRGDIRTVPLSSETCQGVFAEWCAQIERAISYGLPISHLDSHHQIHTDPRLFGVLKAVQRRFGIRKVRITRNLYRPGESVNAWKRLAKTAWITAVRYRFYTRTCDWFTAFEDFVPLLDTGVEYRGTVELMCHPGGERFAAETMLLHGEWTNSLAQFGRLINYNEL